MSDEFAGRGQVTIFVILAIVIVGGILIFFAFRENLFGERISAEFAPIYNLYEECVRQETENALSLLGSQGGRIDVGEYVPGSDYAPFSSHLNFLGIPVPYWYYAAGNGLIKENIPTKSDMEDEVSAFLEERVNDCDFGQFYEQGFFVELDEPRVETRIQDDRVLVEVDMNLVSIKEEKSARKGSYNVEVASKIGKFYDDALKIYDKEKENVFLENYAVDVLNLYAPVDGVEIQCSPKIWKTPEVVDGLKKGLEANIAAIKMKGSYYRNDEKDDDYFVVNADESFDDAVRFVYLAEEFPSKVEITPASQTLMMAEPVGTQGGMGIMGFCYVPYHFVYDASFPVIVQISDGLEVFQFPLAVIVDNNLPRVAELSDVLINEGRPDVCAFKEGNALVYTYDANLNPVEADIEYNCFDRLCDLGKTKIEGDNAVLDAEMPVCVNGYLIAKAEGYAEKKQLFSSNSESTADIILDREYDVDVGLKVGGKNIGASDTAVVHFKAEEGSVSAVFPESRKVNLKEALYDVEVYVYGNSSVVIPGTTKRECFETSRGGVLGFFGATKEECINVQIPDVKIDYALVGGGKTTSYILESDLQSGKIIIDVSELPKPTSLEQLQYNYEVFDTLGVRMNFT